MSVLELGMTGDLVKQWQKALNTMGYQCSIDGNFGKETQAITARFQTENGLQVDGDVGRQTIQAMRNIIDGTNIKIPDVGDLPSNFSNIFSSPLFNDAGEIISAATNQAKKFPWKLVGIGIFGFLAYKKYKNEKVEIFGKRII